MAARIVTTPGGSEVEPLVEAAAMAAGLAHQHGDGDRPQKQRGELCQVLHLPTSFTGASPYQRTSCRASAALRYSSAALLDSPRTSATSPSATHAPARWLTVSTATKQSAAALNDSSASSIRPSDRAARPI